MKRTVRLTTLTLISSIALTTASFAKDMKMDSHKMMNHSPEMMNVMNDTMTSMRSLITMGNKIIADGNASGESEKMMMGAKMMLTGIGMLSHHMMHHKMEMKKSSSKNDMSHSPALSADVLASLKKMADDSSMALIKMGNKMVSEGNTSSNAQKMMAGGDMLEKGMMIHHMTMMEKE